MKTKEFKGIISQNAVRDNSLILNIIEYSCIPFNSWFETHSRLIESISAATETVAALSISAYKLRR